MSLAARPGNFGTRFHNYLYDALGLNYVYKAFSTTDLAGAITGVRALSIRGCALSMPFKEAVIPMLDDLDASAAAIESVNTIVNDNGFLRAYNTDYLAIQKLIEQHNLNPELSNPELSNPELSVAVRGSGGMAKAVASAFKDSGFKQGVIVARNESAGVALATACGFWWSPDPVQADILVNVTPIGMSGSSEEHALAFSSGLIAQAKVVFDVVALPAETPLIKEARNQNKPVITGLEVIALQALEQFVLYTNIRPTPQQVAAAVAFARS